MHVDINWIKQRPHFIAEELSKSYDMLVTYPYFYTRKVLNKDNSSNYRTKRIYRIPNRVKVKLLHTFSDWINGKLVQGMIRKNNPDYLYLCAPRQIYYIPENFKGRVIYDCMDDLIALANGEMAKEITKECEQKLVARVDKILASSYELTQVLCSRYGIDLDLKIEIVRNAYSGKILELENDDIKTASNIFTICYFGTIASWFDFEFLTRALEEIANIEFLLIGPVVDGVEIPKNGRIRYLGVVDHAELEGITKQVSCFIMPFLVNDIIKSVDPVKFYEYINFNKNIITVYYKEIERFEKYVFFYKTYSQFKQAITDAMTYETPKYTYNERKEFLEKNSWERRCVEIKRIIEGLDMN